MKLRDIPLAFSLIGRAFHLWWADWANYVLVSLAFILMSLTVIFAGPAVFGVYACTAGQLNGQPGGIGGWWQGVKAHFWTGLLWGMTNLFTAVLIGFNIWFYSQTLAFWAPVLVVMFMILAVLWFAMQFFALGYFFEQEDKSLGLAWKNSFLTMLGAPVLSIILIVFVLFLMLVSLGLLLPFFIGSVPLFSLLSHLAVRNRLEVYGLRPPDA